MLPENIRIFLRRDPTDMRLGYNGLSALVGSTFGQNPTSGHLFVFVNRHRNRAKMLLWERGGFWLLSRRLEQGTFALPEPAPGAGAHRRPRAVGYVPGRGRGREAPP
jgi:transposase